MNDPNRTLGPEEAADRAFAVHEPAGGRLDVFTERPERLSGGALPSRVGWMDPFDSTDPPQASILRFPTTGHPRGKELYYCFERGVDGLYRQPGNKGKRQWRQRHFSHYRTSVAVRQEQLNDQDS